MAQWCTVVVLLGLVPRCPDARADCVGLLDATLPALAAPLLLGWVSRSAAGMQALAASLELIYANGKHCGASCETFVNSRAASSHTDSLHGEYSAWKAILGLEAASRRPRCCAVVLHYLAIPPFHPCSPASLSAPVQTSLQAKMPSEDAVRSVRSRLCRLFGLATRKTTAKLQPACE